MFISYFYSDLLLKYVHIFLIHIHINYIQEHLSNTIDTFVFPKKYKSLKLFDVLNTN